MPFIPHTQEDIQAMLNTIGVDNIGELFDEVPESLKIDSLTNVPVGLNEMDVTKLMNERARQTQTLSNFIGAGAYEHHVPAAVWDIVGRGEFMTAYTPYQAEASQGTLQLIYEYQTMMASLTGMDVSNASLYDGASALAECVLMAVRANRQSKSKQILIPSTVNPYYKKVVHTVVNNQNIELIDVPFQQDNGVVSLESLAQYEGQDIAALVIPQPNFFGQLEAVDELTNWAHHNKILVIALVNPLALAVLKPPGQWGEDGADIVCGEGQPLGIPLMSGGPYFGFATCKKALVRQMPGRIIGRTVDLDGKEGFTLTLQAREQHIRRSKATSNICTNQGLLVTAATIYMSIMGPEGLRKAALKSHQNTHHLAALLTSIEGVSLKFAGHYFHEVCLALSKPVKPIVEGLLAKDIMAGFALGKVYSNLDNTLLVCATETKTEADMQAFAEALKQQMEQG